jgi:hypothetical protein
MKITTMNISPERLREIALRFVPKVPLETTIPEKYDALHIRRGDAMTSGEGCKYFHAMDYIAKTTCDDVFVMSDDYRVLAEISGSKKIHHMIPETEVGNWTTDNYTTQDDQPIFSNRKDKLDVTKRLIQEMYIAAKSQRFIYTYSNVAFFIKLIHRDPSQCIYLQNTVTQ